MHSVFSRKLFVVGVFSGRFTKSRALTGNGFGRLKGSGQGARGGGAPKPEASPRVPVRGCPPHAHVDGALACTSSARRADADLFGRGTGLPLRSLPRWCFLCFHMRHLLFSPFSFLHQTCWGTQTRPPPPRGRNRGTAGAGRGSGPEAAAGWEGPRHRLLPLRVQAARPAPNAPPPARPSPPRTLLPHTPRPPQGGRAGQGLGLLQRQD